MTDILLNQCLVKTDDALEQVDRLITIVDLSLRELVDTLVIGLELACLEERNGVSHQVQGCQLGQRIIVIESLFTLLNVLSELDDTLLNLVLAHEY